jgi:hypothetical protein
MKFARKTVPLLLVSAAMAAGLSAFAFTATNTVPASNAGAGSNTVSGYTISNIDYTLDAVDADDIDAVEFDLSPAPPASSDVVIELNAQAYTCTVAASTATCNTTAPQADVTATTSLRVVAVD